MSDLTQIVEERVEGLDPTVEVIAVQRFGPDGLRVFIDHPDGVDLGLCERVSSQLNELTADYSLEVSSPGLDRPLTKTAHYLRFLGHKVEVRLRVAQAGRKNFTGQLESADEQSITVVTDDGEYEIPTDSIHRTNLVPEFSEVSQ